MRTAGQFALRAWIFSALGCLLLAGHVSAQNPAQNSAQNPAPNSRQSSVRLELKVAPPPYYVGMPFDLHLQIEGLERTPDPTCSAPPVDGAVMSLMAIVPSVSTRVSIINGRTSRSERVTFVCRFSLTVAKPGEIRLGPFHVVQSGLQSASPVYSIQIESIAADPRVGVRLVLPEGPFIVGQRLPLGIEWWLEEGLQDSIQNYEIHSQLFEMPDAFRFIDERPPNQGEQTLTIQTDTGELTFPAVVENRSEGGGNFLVVRAQRTLVPLQPGDFELGSATISLNEVLRWQRDFFGGRRPSQTRRIFGNGVDQRVRVREAPSKDRPPSYAGAIGRGFSFEVAADRSVVQRGDPIVLTFKVRGEASLDSVGLAGLVGEGALSEKSFALSGEQPPGEIVDGAKIFRVPVRILDESLEEIPALPYSWFDPELGEYQTVYSRPIALSVRPAQLISAADVVSAPAQESPAPRSTESAPSERNSLSRGSGFSLTGANLAIETRRDRLRGREESRAQRLGLVYAASILLGIAAWFYRRRQDRDPEVLRIAASYREQCQRIQAAASMPRKQALGEVASALRELGSLERGEPDPAREALIAECDAIFYAPRFPVGPTGGVTTHRESPSPGRRIRTPNPEVEHMTLKTVTKKTSGFPRTRATSALACVALLCLAILCLAPVAASAPAAEDAEPWLASGISSYTLGMESPDRDVRLRHFAESERFFAAAIEAGANSADSWTNLGNAAVPSRAAGPGHSRLPAGAPH